jgi:hypothetical protein
MRVSIEDNSIPNTAILDYGSSASVSSSGGSGVDSSIITLVAGVKITANQLVGLSGGLAVLADYTNVPCIGIALDTVTANSNLRIKIQGILNIFNNTANEYYLGSLGNVRAYSYESNKLLQKVADKIDNNRILLNISKSVLME